MLPNKAILIEWEKYLIPKNKPTQGKVKHSKWDNHRSYNWVAENNGDDKHVNRDSNGIAKISRKPSFF